MPKVTHLPATITREEPPMLTKFFQALSNRRYQVSVVRPIPPPTGQEISAGQVANLEDAGQAFANRVHSILRQAGARPGSTNVRITTATMEVEVPVRLDSVLGPSDLMAVLRWMLNEGGLSINVQRRSW